jgi:hypothetical protein
MSGLEFLSALIGYLLSWPVLLLVLVLVFRRPLVDLLGRLKNWEGFGQRAEFGETADRVAETAEAAIEAKQVGASPVEDIERYGSLALEADSNPSYVVTAAWHEMEEPIRQLARLTLDYPEDRVALSSVGSLVSALRRREILDSSSVEGFNQLRTLRNAVAHGQHNPTPGEALAFLNATVEVSRYLQQAIARAGELDK